MNRSTAKQTTVKPPPVILVTGSAKRIGAEIIKQAHADGFNVIVHYNHSKHDAEQLINQLNQQRPHSAKAVQANLTIIDKVQLLEDFVTEVMDCFGRLDALVHNASRFYPTLFSQFSNKPLVDNYQSIKEDWEELFLTNTKAPFVLTYAFLPYLRATQGNVVSILDIHANDKPFKNYSIYNMAKSSGKMMVQSLALELAPDIRVNAVAPGTNIFPEMNSDQSIEPSKQQKILNSIPLQRIGTPNDIAQAVLFLLAADYITGQVINVDGGRGLTLAGND